MALGGKRCPNREQAFLLEVSTVFPQTHIFIIRRVGEVHSSTRTMVKEMNVCIYAEESLMLESSVIQNKRF